LTEAIGERGDTLSSTAIVSFFAGVGMVLGLGTNTLIAKNFGASRPVDALMLARSVPDFLIMLLGLDMLRGIATALFAASGTTQQERRDLYAALFNWVLAVAGIAGLLTFLGAPWLMALLARGFDPVSRAQATHLCRVVIPVLPLLALAYFVGAVGNAYRRFAVPATIRALPHVGAIACILLLTRSLGIASVAVGLVAGSALALAAQVVGLKGLGLRPRAKLNLWTPAVRQTARLGLPLMVVMVASQASVLATRHLGSYLPSGRISALWFALMLLGLVRGVVVDPVCTVALPRLSRLAGDAKSGALRDALGAAARPLVFATILATALLIFAAHPIVRLLYQRGAFDAEATHITALAVVYYGAGLPPQALAWMLIQVFLALRETRSLAKISVRAYTLQIVLSVALVRPVGYLGLALAQSIAMGVYAVDLAVGLRRHMGAIGGREMVWSALRCSAAGAATAAVTIGLQRFRIGEAASLGLLLLHVAILLAAGATAYLTICAVLLPSATRHALAASVSMFTHRSRAADSGERGADERHEASGRP